jgi:hypothetical protein
MVTKVRVSVFAEGDVRAMNFLVLSHFLRGIGFLCHVLRYGGRFLGSVD